MISFLLAPVMSFFSIRLYQKALKSRQGYGFGFLLYLTFLFCCLLVFLCFFLFLPVAGGFVNWLIDVTPEVTITADGLTTKVAQPYSVRYPAFGTMYVIDTSKELDELTKLADQTKAAVVIGKKYVVVKKPQTVQRVYPLDQLMNKVKQSNRPIVITKALMHRIVNRIFSLVVPLAVLVLAPIFFVWKLLIALAYALIGLVLNLFNKDKLKYGSIFNVACLSLAPVTVMQAVNFSVPNMYFNLNVYFAFGLTLAYLAYGMFIAKWSMNRQAAKGR